MKKTILVTLLCVVFARGIRADDIRTFTETLNEASARSKASSGLLKASTALVEAADFQTTASLSALFPRLTIDGYYSYQTAIPTVNIGALLGNPNAPAVQFGTNSNYSAGPTLSYTLFDGFQTRKSWKSSESNFHAKSENQKATERQLELNTHLAYFKVQFNLKALLLTATSLKLSQAQDHDIENRFQAGAASKLEKITSHQGVLNYLLQFRQTQTELAASIRQLLAMTGEQNQFDSSRPIPAEIASTFPSGIDSPTVLVRLDQLEDTLGAMGHAPLSEPDSQHPQIRALEFSSDSLRLSSESYMAALWPKIQLSAKALIMYPNGPEIQTVNQNIFMVSLSMPLFEGDLSRSFAGQRMRESLANDFQKEQKLTDLQRDWQIAKDQVDSLRVQQKVAEQNVAAAEEVEQLTYKSYKAGKVNFLDVQTVNQKLLQAQVNAAQIQSNTLMQIAQLEYLSGTRSP
jgi:outer membrane protein